MIARRTGKAATASPVVTGAITPEFIRLPKPGRTCPYTGMTRSSLNELILPTPRNNHKPPVRSFCLRHNGSATGVRLIGYKSLIQFILKHAEGGAQ